MDHCGANTNWDRLEKLVFGLHWNGKKVLMLSGQDNCQQDDEDEDSGYLGWAYNGLSGAAGGIVSSSLSDAYDYGKSAFSSSYMSDESPDLVPLKTKGAWFAREREITLFENGDITEYKLYRTHKLCYKSKKKSDRLVCVAVACRGGR